MKSILLIAVALVLGGCIPSTHSSTHFVTNENGEKICGKVVMVEAGRLTNGDPVAWIGLETSDGALHSLTVKGDPDIGQDFCAEDFACPPTSTPAN